MKILNDVFETTEQFHLVYRDVINDCINLIAKSEPTKENLLLLYYLNICLNPYLIF